MSLKFFCLQRQAGAVRLGWVLGGSALVAALGMTALASLRSERNLFAEGASALSQAVGNSSAASAVRAQAPATRLRQCRINGTTVISNEDCKDSNPTSRDLAIRMTSGVEAPRVPVVPAAQRGADPALDKIIEKQSQ